MNNRYGERFNPTGFKFFQISDLLMRIRLTSRSKSEIIKTAFEITVFIISVLCVISYYVFLKSFFEIGQIPSAYGSTFVVIKIDSFIIVISYVEKAYYT